MNHLASRVQTSVAAILLCCVANAQANDAKKVQVDIQQQPVLGALKALGEQTGLQLLMRVDGVSADAITVQPVSGQLSVKAALDKLLASTGLTYEFINDRTIRISKRELRPTSAIGDSSVRPFRVADAGRVALADAVDSGGRTESSASSSRAEAASKSGMEEVLVTAQKREENVLEVPQSVTVISAADLAKLGATQFRDFASTIPGLTFATSGAGYTQISLRGVTAGFDVGSTVGIYVDEVPFGSSGAFANSARSTLDASLYDVQRIEVLRGPQGTLYGASSIGGLLKYVTRPPDMTRFGGDAQAGVSGTHGGGVNYNAAAGVNVPLVTDKLALRVSAFQTHDDGFIDNVTLGQKDVNQADIYGGRVDLLFQATDRLSVRLNGFAQNITRDGLASADYAGDGKPLFDDLDQTRLISEPFDQRVRVVSGTVSMDFDWATLTSVSSYQATRMEYIADISPRWVGLMQLFNRTYGAVGLSEMANTDKFTQEVRLNSEQGASFEWVVGAFYNDEKSRRTQDVVPFVSASQRAEADIFNFLSPSKYEEYAGFGDVTWHITSQLAVTGGIRHAENRQSYQQICTSGLDFCTTQTPIRSNESVSTYLANARFEFTDHASVYFRYATGYRPGGPNFSVRDTTTGQLIGAPNFEADRLKSFELGFKAETDDRRFGFDVDVYDIDWSNIQVLTSVGGFSAIVNAAGGATVHGAELSMSARPSEAFVFGASLAYADATLDENSPELAAKAGERLPNVPRFTAAASADYELPVGNLRPTFGATVRRVSDRNASYDASGAPPQYLLPAYTSLDLRSGVTLGSVDLQLYIHNLLNKDGQLGVPNTIVQANGPRPVSILQPRTFGVTASMKF